MDITVDELKAWAIKNIPPFLIKPFQKTLHRNNSTFFADGFATVHHVEFFNDSFFIQAYNDAYQGLPKRFQRWRDEKTLAWRAHIYVWSALLASRTGGVFVECGVWYGILASVLCRYLESNHIDSDFYLFDTFGSIEGSHPDYQADIWGLVQERFAPYSNVRLVRGVLPQSLDSIEAESKISFLSIDINSNSLEVEILEALWSRIPIGGVIYLDDYGWPYPGLRSTINDFCTANRQSLLHFPSGNSIMIKS